MEQKENRGEYVKSQVLDTENRILELETSLLYFSKAHSEIVHNLNSSSHKLLSYSYILGRNIDYFEHLINMYQELSSKEVDSKIKEIKQFKDGVTIESIKKLSIEAVKSIEFSVKQIHKDSNELHLLSREISKVI
ncbi:MAG: hypothetical protein NZ604_06475 [Flavobacteriales bacterium]|nr:hypothetical protein [Flavobacteriales bacterium]